MKVKVSVSGGAFELETGWPWTAGLSPFRHKDEFNIRWCQETKRHLFDMKGKTYSAKQISPHLKDIQTIREY
jgi:hypothetical protein